MADRLLQRLGAEREYVQLHRDTTLQSLTVLPSLEGGRIAWEDSPLVKAVSEGRVLVVDEADKAPTEVVCLLKTLLEDGEMLLGDGRRILSQENLRRWQVASGNASGGGEGGLMTREEAAAHGVSHRLRPQHPSCREMKEGLCVASVPLWKKTTTRRSAAFAAEYAILFHHLI